MARQSENACSLEEAARSLGVSRRTICRDIYELAMIGVAIRISGDRVVCEGGEYQVEADAVAMRRLAILSLLASGPRTLSDITAYVCDERRGFDVDERTVRRDIEHMVSAGYVVERADEAEGPKSYALSELFMPRFSLPFSQLAAVMRALDTSPAALADPVTAASIKGKLMAALMPDPSPVDRVCRRRHIVGRARIASSSMLSKVDALELAAMEGRVVEMVYRGPKAQGESKHAPRAVEPLGVVYYWFHDAWYLVARCRQAGDVRHFRVDRIQSFALTDELFQPPSGFSLEDYMQGPWGVYRGEPVRIRVRFFDEYNVIDRVKAETAHRRQAKLVPVAPGQWEYTDIVMGLSEFRTWLRSFGSSAMVLEPESLRDELVASARRMKEMYSRQVSPDEVQ